MDTLSLFTGAGGLDLGLEAAGYNVAGCVEFDADARSTLQENRPNWNLALKPDIFDYSPSALLREFGIRKKKLHLVSGGPPCQPFSKAGQWTSSGSTRLNDPRSKTLSAFLSIVEEALPETFILENVKGILSKQGEVLKHIEKLLWAINKYNRTNYNLQVLHFDASDFGIPQIRERVILFAHRDGRQIISPEATHSDAPGSGLLRKATAWDAIGSLKLDSEHDLRLGGKWADLLPSIPEGKNYLWHTPKGQGMPLFGYRTRYWSFLLKLAKNQPSWTIQAAPGPAIGPFHWDNRRLSVRELARLQSFPDGYKFCGTYMAARKQIGNAVPSGLAELIGNEIKFQIFGESKRELTLIPKLQTKVPSPGTFKPVPEKFLSLRKNHKPHPGTGRGPQPRLIEL